MRHALSAARSAQRAELQHPLGGTLLDVDVSGWKHVGTTSNTEYYVVEPQVLAVVPNTGVEDTEKTARENLELQVKWLRSVVGVVVLVFFDRLAYQEKCARTVCQEADPGLMRASALIGGKAIQRTLASFFLRLFKPRTPTQLFADLPSARAWARQMNRAASKPAA